MAETPKFGISKLEPQAKPRVDRDFNEALDKVDARASVSLSGPEANRPETARAGTYYYATDTNRYWRNNGSSWIQISPAPNGSITGDSLAAGDISGKKYDLSSAITWRSLDSIIEPVWTKDVDRPLQWTIDHMGFVRFRGRVEYPSNTPAPGTSQFALIFPTRQPFFPSEVYPPAPALEEEEVRSATSILNAGLIWSRFVPAEATPWNPSGQPIHGFYMRHVTTINAVSVDFSRIKYKAA